MFQLPGNTPGCISLFSLKIIFIYFAVEGTDGRIFIHLDCCREGTTQDTGLSVLLFQRQGANSRDAVVLVKAALPNTTRRRKDR